jgi:ankyrin repeat protein
MHVYIMMLYSYSEIERLLRDGIIYVEFKYAWHWLLPRRHGFYDDDELQTVEDCLKHGANPSNRGGPGVTALMLTCKNLHIHDHFWDPTAAEQVVTLLLDHGAEVNQQDYYGRTALHYAFDSIYDKYLYPFKENLVQKRVVKILIQHNADIYLKDSCGLSAIDMAKREGHESWLRTDEAALTGTCSKKGKTVS